MFNSGFWVLVSWVCVRCFGFVFACFRMLFYLCLRGDYFRLCGALDFDNFWAWVLYFLGLLCCSISCILEFLLGLGGLLVS